MTLFTSLHTLSKIYFSFLAGFRYSSIDLSEIIDSFRTSFSLRSAFALDICQVVFFHCMWDLWVIPLASLLWFFTFKSLRPLGFSRLQLVCACIFISMLFCHYPVLQSSLFALGTVGSRDGDKSEQLTLKKITGKFLKSIRHYLIMNFYAFLLFT